MDPRTCWKGRSLNMVASQRRWSPGMAMMVCWLCGVCVGPLFAAEPAVVINELHVNPDVKTELVEFVELCNLGTTDVDLSGWQLADGIFFTFPAGATLPASGFVIVAQDPQQIHAK